MADATGAPRHPGGRLPWVLARVVVVAGLVAAAWMTTSCLRQCTPGGIASSTGDAVRGNIREIGEQARATLRTLDDMLKPSVVVHPLAVIRGEDPSPKLVVHTLATDVAVDAVEDHWYGDTYSRIVARNCRVQFVIPLDRMTDRDLVAVPASGDAPARIVVIAPRPRVDAEMAAIDPESIEFTERNTGLRYARSWLGMDNRDAMVRQLRPKLLEAVSDPAVRARAEQSAREFFEKRFAEWLRSELRMGRDVTIDVRWTE